MSQAWISFHYANHYHHRHQQHHYVQHSHHRPPSRPLLAFIFIFIFERCAKSIRRMASFPFFSFRFVRSVHLPWCFPCMLLLFVSSWVICTPVLPCRVTFRFPFHRDDTRRRFEDDSTCHRLSNCFRTHGDGLHKVRPWRGSYRKGHILHGGGDAGSDASDGNVHYTTANSSAPSEAYRVRYE